VTIGRQHGDDSVEVAVFHVEFNNAALDVLDVDHDVCSKQFWCYALREFGPLKAAQCVA
jgi:hypothetical protein